MKTIIVKVNDAVKTVAEHQVVTKDGQPTVIKAVNRVNYELVDQATGRAPDHIITKRVGKDLHVSVEENGQDSDLIIEGYYEESDSALIGLAEDGSYYYYVPDTGEVADFVTELAPGAVEGQALGGNAYSTPWWVGATDQAGFGILPWLVGLAGLGALIAALDDDDDDKSTPAPAPEAPADVHVDKAENVPPAEGDDRDNGSTIITGTAQPNTEVVIKDKDGNIVGKGETDKDGNFTVKTDKPLAHNEKYDVIAQDKDGNQIGEKDTVIGSLADPKNPELVANDDGSVTAKPGDDSVVDLTVEFIDENEQPQKVEIVKDKDGSWGPKPDTNLPEGVEVNKETGEITLTPDAVKDGSEVTATNHDIFGQDSTAKTNAGNDIEGAVAPASPDLVATPDGGIEMTPSEDADKGKVEFTDEAGSNQTVEIEKGEDGSWGPKPGIQLPPGVTVDPETGKVTIAPEAVEDGSTVKAENSNDNGTSNSEVIAGDNDANTDDIGPAAPDLVATPDGGIEMTPSKDADKGKVDFTDESGNDHTVEIEKDPNTGEWGSKDDAVLPPGVTVDPETGKVTITPDAVEDGSKVEAENSNDNGTSSSEITAGNDIEDITPPAAPEIVAGADGSVSITPDQKDAVDLIVEFTDEADKPQKVELEKDADGKWTAKDELPEGVTVDPDTGRVDIHYDAVKDESEVNATNKDEVGNASSSQATTSRDYINGPKVEIQAGEDGVIDPTDLNENKEVDVVVDIKDSGLKAGDKLEVTNQDGETKEVVLTEEDITNGSVTVPVKPAEHGKDTTVDVVVKDESGKQIGSGSDTAPTDFRVPGDTNGDGIPDAGPVISFPEDADNNGYLNAAEDQAPKGETPVRVELPVNTEAGDIVEVVINGEKKEVVLTEDNIKDGFVDVPVKLDTNGDGKVDLDKVDVTATVKDNAGNVTPEDNKVLNIDTKVPGDVDGDGSATDPNDPSKGDPEDNDATTNNGAPIITFPEDTNGDGFLNAAENKQNPDSTPVRVTTPANTEEGDKVVITTNTGEKVEVTVTQEDIDKGYIETEVTIPTDAEGNKTKLEVEAHVEDKAGNKSHTATNSLDVDTRVPGDSDGDGKPDEAGKPVVEIADGNDGFINKDDLNEDGTVNTTITFPKDSGYTPGDNVVVKDQDGNKLLDRPLTAEDIANGITVPVTPAPEGEKTEVTAQVTDPAGNSSLEGKDESVTDLIVPGMGNPDLVPQVTIADGEDGKINKADLNADGEATATVKFPENAGYSAGDTVVITKPDGTAEEVTLDADKLANGVEVTFKPLPEGETNEVKAVVKDPQGNTSGAGKDTSITDLLIPGDSDGDGIADDVGKPVVEIADGKDVADQIDTDDLNEDGTVNATVTLPKDAGYSVGDNIVIKDNAGNVLVDRPLRQEDLDNGITVKVTPPAEGKTLEVTAEVTDPQDNSAEGKDTSKVGDITAPNAPVVDILEGNDNVIDGKDLNKDGEVDVKVYLPKGTQEGDTLTVNGTDYTVTEDMLKEGSTIVSVPALAEGETLNVTATITDKAGNKSEKGTDNAVFGDITATSAPTVTIQDGEGTANQLDDADLVDGKVAVKVEAPADAKPGNILTVTNPDGSNTNYPITQDILDNGLTIKYPVDQFPVDTKVAITAVVTDKAGNVSEPGMDETTNKIVNLPPVDPDAPMPTLTVDLQDSIDATVDPDAPNDPIMATITGTTDAEPGSKVSIVVGEYDENGVLVPGTELPAVEAEVQADGTYSVEVDVTTLNNTDETGDAEQDKHTIGAIAKVVDKVSGNTATAEDLAAEKAENAGLSSDDVTDEIQDLFNATGLNNDMTLVYGPSETVMVRKQFPNFNSGFTISEDTSYTDPLLFTNYDDVLVINNSLNNLGNNADAPNDGGNEYFKSADNDRSLITIDTGMGDDLFSVSQVDAGVNARIYMGEGKDTFRTTVNDIGRSNNVYMESGDDTVDVAKRVLGKVYTGSGSDTVDVGTDVAGLIDLGSGDTPDGYMTEYQDGSGLSLGNDDNIDSFDDINELTIGGYLGTAAGAGYVKSGNGKDIITIKKSIGGAAAELYTGVVDTGAGDDIINVDGSIRVNGTIYAGEGNDEVNIGGDVIGKIYTQEGDDTVKVTGNVTGKISTDTGEDKIFVNGNVNGGLIDSGAQDDHIQIKGEVVSSKVWGGSGNDTIIVEDRVRLDSEIIGGAGDDKIYVKSLHDPNSVISGGVGSDVIILETLAGGTVNTGNSNWNVNASDLVSRNE
ncbi:Ig-like domain-containing protein, partial [Psychrobacter phenylpyruvicus]